MIQLTNGCTCTIPKIYPKNWQDKNTSTAKDWYIYYTFHDPMFLEQYPEGKPVQVKKGINYFKDLKPRQEAISIILEATNLKLKEKGYNPITDQFMKVEMEEIIDYEVHPDTPILEALNKAIEKRSHLDRQTLADYKSMMKYFSKSILELRYEAMAIKDVKRRHIKIALQNCKKTPDRTNKYRSHLQGFFKDLMEMETVESNPIDDIAILKSTGPKKKRDTLTPEQRRNIDYYLNKVHYSFWRYMHIFFHSGSRSTELFNIQAKDVNLKKQSFKVIIKKGRQYTEVEKVIKDIAMPLWAEILSKSRPDDYIFSFGFIPGSLRANTDRINKLWKKLVKDNEDLGKPQADFYSLKHLHTTEVVEMLNNALAAKHNSHTTTKMVDTIYDVNLDKRKAETVKELMNEF